MGLPFGFAQDKKARAFTGTAEATRHETSGEKPRSPAQDVGYQGAGGSLGSLRSLGMPILVGSSLVKEHSALVERADEFVRRYYAGRLPSEGLLAVRSTKGP